MSPPVPLTSKVRRAAVWNKGQLMYLTHGRKSGSISIRFYFWTRWSKNSVIKKMMINNQMEVLLPIRSDWSISVSYTLAAFWLLTTGSLFNEASVWRGYWSLFESVSGSRLRNRNADMPRTAPESRLKSEGDRFCVEFPEETRIADS